MRCRLRSSVLSHGTRHQHSHTFMKGPILNRVPALSKQLTELYVVRHFPLLVFSGYLDRRDGGGRPAIHL